MELFLINENQCKICSTKSKVRKRNYYRKFSMINESYKVHPKGSLMSSLQTQFILRSSSFSIADFELVLMSKKVVSSI